MESSEPADSKIWSNGELSGCTSCDPGSGLILVTVIVAAHNADDYIHYALDSVLNNQDVSLEVIVVDDCSSDKTAEVVEGYRSRHNQVVLLRRNKKGGPSAARNDGIRQARGKWIAVLDADDEFLPNRLLQMTAYGQSVSAEAVADNLQLFHFADRTDSELAFPAAWATDEPLSLATFVKRDFPGSQIRWRSLGLCKPLLLRQAIVDRGLLYDEDVSMAEDLLFYCRLIATGGRFMMIKDAYYRYALRSQSLSQREAPSAINSANLRKLLLVNTRIAEMSSSEAFIRLLEDRRRALWYEQFSRALKDWRPLLSCTALWQAGLIFVGKRMLERFVGRLRSAVARS